MRLAQFVVLVTLSLFTTACRQAPDLIDYFDPADTPRQLWFKPEVVDSAPIVIVGKMLSIRPVGRPIRAARSPGVELQLTELNVIVENVLRGSVTGSVATFYMYLLSQVGGEEYVSGLKYHAEAGERRVYFLKRDKGVLRSVGDVMRCYTIRIYSGSHELSRMSPGISVREAISVLLLSEGVEMTCEFAAGLDESYRLAVQLTSKKYAMALLSALHKTTHDGLVDLVIREILVAEEHE